MLGDFRCVPSLDLSINTKLGNNSSGKSSKIRALQSAIVQNLNSVKNPLNFIPTVRENLKHTLGMINQLKPSVDKKKQGFLEAIKLSIKSTNAKLMEEFKRKKEIKHNVRDLKQSLDTIFKDINSEQSSLRSSLRTSTPSTAQQTLSGEIASVIQNAVQALNEIYLLGHQVARIESSQLQKALGTLIPNIPVLKNILSHTIETFDANAICDSPRNIKDKLVLLAQESSNCFFENNSKNINKALDALEIKLSSLTKKIKHTKLNRKSEKKRIHHKDVKKYMNHRRFTEKKEGALLSERTIDKKSKSKNLKFSELKTEINGLKTEKESLIQQLNASISTMNNIHVTYGKFRENLETDLSYKDSLIQKQKKDIELKINLAKTLSISNSLKIQQLDRIQKYLSTEVAVIDTEDIDTFVINLIQNQTRQIDYLTGRIEEITKDNHSLNENILELNTELESLKFEYDTLLKDTEEQENTLKELKSKNSKLLENINEANREMERIDLDLKAQYSMDFDHLCDMSDSSSSSLSEKCLSDDENSKNSTPMLRATRSDPILIINKYEENSPEDNSDLALTQPSQLDIFAFLSEMFENTLTITDKNKSYEFKITNKTSSVSNQEKNECQ